MSHHHYEDVVDPKTNKTYRETKEMRHHYDDGPDIATTNKRIQEIEDEKTRLENEKQSLIKKEELKNKEAKELSDKLQTLKADKNELEKEIVHTQKKLYKLCTHEKLKKQSRTIPGGYLNQREYITEYWCELCGIMVDRDVKYGGFE